MTNFVTQNYPGAIGADDRQYSKGAVANELRGYWFCQRGQTGNGVNIPAALAQHVTVSIDQMIVGDVVTLQVSADGVTWNNATDCSGKAALYRWDDAGGLSRLIHIPASNKWLRPVVTGTGTGSVKISLHAA